MSTPALLSVGRVAALVTGVIYGHFRHSSLQAKWDKEHPKVDAHAAHGTAVAHSPIESSISMRIQQAVARRLARN
jgi:ATP synthase E chain